MTLALRLALFVVASIVLPAGVIAAQEQAPERPTWVGSFGAGLAASVTNRTQMKVEVLNTYRTTPPLATIERSDLSTLMSFVVKF